MLTTTTSRKYGMVIPPEWLAIYDAAQTPEAAEVPDPSKLYVFNDTPTLGQQLVLTAAKARVDVVLVPEVIDISEVRVTDNATGVESLVTRYAVAGYTDRDQYMAFTAETVPGLFDEIRLASPLEFF